MDFKAAITIKDIESHSKSNFHTYRKKAVFTLSNLRFCLTEIGFKGMLIGSLSRFEMKRTYQFMSHRLSFYNI